MKVFVLQNNDGIVLGIFSTKGKADRFAKTVGRVRWHEAWKVVPKDLDKLDADMFLGSESFQKMCRQIRERQKKGAK